MRGITHFIDCFGASQFAVKAVKIALFGGGAQVDAKRLPKTSGGNGSKDNVTDGKSFTCKECAWKVQAQND